MKVRVMTAVALGGTLFFGSVKGENHGVLPDQPHVPEDLQIAMEWIQDSVYMGGSGTFVTHKSIPFYANLPKRFASKQRIVTLRKSRTGGE